MTRFNLFRLKASVCIGLGTLLTGLYQLPARSEITVDSWGNLGNRWDTRFEQKILLEERGSERLYEVELIRTTTLYQQAPEEEAFSVYVLCSQARPTYMSENANGDYYGRRLALAEHPIYELAMPHNVYWTTCHDFLQPYAAADVRRRRAIEFGYRPSEEGRNYGAVLETIEGESLEDVLPW